MNGTPCHEIRRGCIKVRIWRRRAKQVSSYSVSVVRLIRNGDLWQESSRFSRNDLPLVRVVLDEAHAWLLLQGTGNGD